MATPAVPGPDPIFSEAHPPTLPISPPTIHQTPAPCPLICCDLCQRSSSSPRWIADHLARTRCFPGDGAICVQADRDYSRARPHCDARQARDRGGAAQRCEHAHPCSLPAALISGPAALLRCLGGWLGCWLGWRLTGSTGAHVLRCVAGRGAFPCGRCCARFTWATRRTSGSPATAPALSG